MKNLRKTLLSNDSKQCVDYKNREVFVINRKHFKSKFIYFLKFEKESTFLQALRKCNFKRKPKDINYFTNKLTIMRASSTYLRLKYSREQRMIKLIVFMPKKKEPNQKHLCPSKKNKTSSICVHNHELAHNGRKWTQNAIT